MAIWDIKERYKLDRGNIGSRSSRIVFENSAASTVLLISALFFILFLISHGSARWDHSE